MAFISQTVPNLIQGVSQQPDSLRYNTQAQKQDNAYGTPVDGLIKRPHTEFIDKLSSADASANQFFHSINRDENERFILEITEASTPTVKVYDTTNGAEKTVHVPDGTTYLDASSPSTAYKALTISDVTFIVNTEKKVEADSSSLGSTGYTLDRSDFKAIYGASSSAVDLPSGFTKGDEKLYYLKQGVLNSQYKLTISVVGTGNTGIASRATGSTSGTSIDDNSTITVGITTEDSSGSDGSINYGLPFPQSTVISSGNLEAIPEKMLAAMMSLLVKNESGDDGIHCPDPRKSDVANDNKLLETGNANSDFKQGIIVRQGSHTNVNAQTGSTTGSHKGAGGIGSVLHFISHSGCKFALNSVSPQNDTTAVVVDSLNGVQSFVDLPPYAPHGFIAKVNGDPESAADDYYVEFVCNAGEGFGNGYWRECLGVKEDTDGLGNGLGRPVGLEKSFDFATMPHILIRQSDDTFMFTKADGTKQPTGAPSGADYSSFKWADRKVGDDETNPFPSFTDKKISNIFLHRGRLGLTADESVVMSSANEFFNMHRTTMTTVLDGDPIDTDVSFRKVSLIRHAIPFNQNLILFSDTDQFALTGSPNLTPITARIVPITSYENVIDAAPVPAASSLYFGFNHGNFAGVRELFPTDSTNFDALDITEAVPAYIPGKVRQFASSTDENIIAVLSSTETSSIYIYRYYEVGSGSQKRKIQSAWSRFTFGSDANIRHISFMDEDLFLMVQRTDGLHLEKMRIETKLVDTGLNFRAMLDRRITYAGTDGTITASFSAATGNTTFTFPYAKRGRNLDGLINNGVRVNVVTQPSDGGTTLICEGDLTSNTIFFGEAYEMDYGFSTAYLRTSSQTAGQQPIVTGRYQLRFGNIIHEDTGFFTVEVASPNRDTAVSTFSGVVVGQDETDALNLSDGTFRFPILLKNTDATINIKNDSPFPSKFMAAAFEASYNTKVRQRL